MLDESIKVEKVEREEYTPLPDDVYTVQLVDVTSEKRPTYDTRNKPESEQEQELVFNFLFGVVDSGDDVRGRRIIQSFVPSYLYVGNKGKNKLYQVFEALQGQTISPEQEAYGISGKDINGLIGKQCRVGTVTKEKDDKKYMNIDKWLICREAKTPLTREELEKVTWPEKKTDEPKNYGNVAGTDIPYPTGEETGADLPNPFKGKDDF